MPAAVAVNAFGTPSLIVIAALPGGLALALGAGLLVSGWARAPGATLVSVGLALTALVVLVVASLRIPALDGLSDSPVALLGLPLAVFVAVLGVLLRRTSTMPLVSVACAIAGLVVLYGLGGVVLMQAACGVHAGGC